MYPSVRRNLSPFGQFDHVHWRRVVAPLARSAFQRSFEFPDRGVARSADRIEREARPALAPIAFDLQPTKPAIEALRDCRRRLRRPAVALHTDRPSLGLGAIGCADGLLGVVAAGPSARIFAHDGATVNRLAGFGAHA
jgi:hypothetical protein